MTPEQENIFEAIIQELTERKEEIIGGKLERLNEVNINITITALESAEVVITRYVTALS